jgi:hypothetical protein
MMKRGVRWLPDQFPGGKTKHPAGGGVGGQQDAAHLNPHSGEAVCNGAISP